MLDNGGEKKLPIFQFFLPLPPEYVIMVKKGWMTKGLFLPHSFSYEEM